MYGRRSNDNSSNRKIPFGLSLNLAFFPVRAATDLESERHSFAFFAETNLSACGFGREIPMLNNVMPRALQLIRAGA